MVSPGGPCRAVRCGAREFHQACGPLHAEQAAALLRAGGVNLGAATAPHVSVPRWYSAQGRERGGEERK
jgi:hypothetical protein